jgi:hypothetical protein
MKGSIYTQSDFARRIGKTRQWVSEKVTKHIATRGHDGTIVFTSLEGNELHVRLIRSEGSLKWLLMLMN